MSARITGRIVRWNDEKGYGFAECSGRKGDVFLHISEFPDASVRPVQGQEISFEIAQDEQRRERGIDIQYVSNRGLRVLLPRFSLVIGLSYFAALGLYGVLHGIHLLVPIWIGVLSVLTYGLFVYDKQCAQQGQWRVPEATLFWVSLAGGWPGGLYAQWSIRHKNRKPGFQSIFWLMVLANVAITAFWFMPAWSEPVIQAVKSFE